MTYSNAVPPSLMTGVASIDAEHGTLIDSLRRLHLAPAGETRSESFLEVISQLGQQLIQHFDNEEKIIRTCDMPVTEVDEHILAHNEILEQYAQLQDDLMSGRHLAQAEILEMIQHWIMTHVVAYDLKIRDRLAH